MKRDIKGYMVLAFDSKTQLVNHIAYFVEKQQAFNHVDNCIIDGFSVICEEARVLVPSLHDDFSFIKSVDSDSDFDN